MDGRTVVSIGGMAFGEQEELPPLPPSKPIWDDDAGRWSVTPGAATLEEARAQLPFPLALPAWIPAGFQREEGLVLLNAPAAQPAMLDPQLARLFRPSVQVLWRDTAGACMSLSIRSAPPPGVHEVRLLQRPIDTLSEVRVGDRPAAVIQRAAGQTLSLRSIFPVAMVHLLWRADGLQYELEAPSDSLSVAELILIAESIPAKA